MLVTGDYRDQMEAIGFHLSDSAKFIGEAIDGKLVSLAAFDNYNGTNIDIHIWADRITRKWLRALGDYAFGLRVPPHDQLERLEQLPDERVSGAAGVRVRRHDPTRAAGFRPGCLRID